MPLQLLEITDADFDELVTCEFESYETPSQPAFNLFFPIIGEGPDARRESIQKAVAMQREEARQDPSVWWGKVVDTDLDGKIVGGCLYKVYKDDPFLQPEDPAMAEVAWQPEGEVREYAKQALHAFDEPRSRLAKRAQVFLNIIFTHAEHRRRGAGDLMLEWGKKKADEMGVEMWLDAGPEGVPLYKKHGFTVIEENTVKPAKENPGDVWKEADAFFQPLVFWHMWRPIRGNYEPYANGQPKPWEAKEEAKEVAN